MENFYVTLPSNSSMDIYPDNAISHYTTRLRQPLNLNNNWEVAIVEASVPTRWKNWLVHIDDRHYMRLGVGTIDKDTGKMIKRYFRANVKSGMYDSATGLENALNEAWNKIRTSVGTNKRFRHATPREEKVFVYNPVNNFLNNVITSSTEHGLSVSKDLGRILGIIDTGKEWLSVPTKLENTKQLQNKTIKVSHLYVYTDIIEYTIVGDTVTPLLRIIPMQSYIGTSTIDHYTHIFNKPHYIPVSRQHIETIHIDIRNDAGINIPFIDDTKCIIKLHFRRRRL